MKAERPKTTWRDRREFWRTRHFWTEAFAWEGSATPRVIARMLVAGLFASVVTLESRVGINLALPFGPYEIVGAVLSLLLVLRTNAGYERWWEARRLWGGIVNQSRNLCIQALSYGPDDARWRDEFVRWSIAFSHVARRSLRGELTLPDVSALLGDEQADHVLRAVHMPSAVTRRIGALLREAHDSGGMSGFAFQRAEQERAALIDHIGGCERILKSPLTKAYSIEVRHFVVIFLVTMPFALLSKLSDDFLVPFFTMLIAYPVLAIDAIGVELQNPFSPTNLGHLPLDDICRTIEKDLLGLLAQEREADTVYDRGPGRLGSPDAASPHSP
jgi:putative membrane protein